VRGARRPTNPRAVNAPSTPLSRGDSPSGAAATSAVHRVHRDYDDDEERYLS
jgi:hypothetical protein